MAGGCDEVEEGVNAIIAESRVTLDARFEGKDFIILSLDVAHDLTKSRLVVNLVAEAWSIHDCERDTGAFLV